MDLSTHNMNDHVDYQLLCELSTIMWNISYQQECCKENQQECHQQYQQEMQKEQQDTLQQECDNKTLSHWLA